MEIETYYPKSQKDWHKWLENHHESKQSIWVIFYRTSSDTPSLSWSDAVDEALCYGWIDSTKKTIDKESYMQYFSRRKPNSTWSKINKDKIVELTKQKRMYQAGIDIIEKAKQNGSWTILDSVEKLIVPEDLKKEFKTNPIANKFYLSLSKSKRKEILAWVAMAKRAETKVKRIKEIVERANENKKPKHIV